MKRFVNIFVYSVLVLALFIGAGVNSPPALAADNTATGDIAGVAGDLTGSNTVTLTSATLALIKRAFLADGTALTTGASLPKGTLVKFMIYINNSTAVPVNDVDVRDVLAATFAYQTGTIKVDNSVNKCAAATCTGPEEAAMFAAVDAKTALTDAVDTDVASYTVATTTIDVGKHNVANGQLNIAADKVWAVLFTVKMQ